MTEVPICFRDREAGESKMSLAIAFEALLLVPRLRRLPRDEDGVPARPDEAQPAEERHAGLGRRL